MVFFIVPWRHVIEEDISFLEIDLKEVREVLGIRIIAPFISEDDIPAFLVWISEDQYYWDPITVDPNNPDSRPQVGWIISLTFFAIEFIF